MDGPQRVNVQAIVLGLGRNALADLFERKGCVQAEPDVLRHSQGVKQAEVLKHHADAQAARFLRVAHLDTLTVEKDIPQVRLH